MRKYDVFISYHRKSGAGFARMLQQALARKGYRCFLDVDAVQDGEFQEKILCALRLASNFLFVLTDGALERISDPNDHIRIELEEAIRLRRKIVVAAPRGCRGGFCNVKLPESLAELSRIQVTLLDVDVFFDKSVDMLEERFKKRKIHLGKRSVFGILSGVVLLVLLTCCILYYDQHRKQLNIGDRRTEDMRAAIMKKMKAMRLPLISFKPPATIIDAVEYFRQASKDFDRPEIPLDRRGFNFVVKTPEAVCMHAETLESDSDNIFDIDDEDNPHGVPVIPMITANDISFYDALMFVCESVDYKFFINDSDIVVMPKRMSLDELQVSYLVVKDSFCDVVYAWEKYDAKGGCNNDSWPKVIEGFFEDFGVEWPLGSSVRYILSVGRLKVINTKANLRAIEKVLSDQNLLAEEGK